MKELMSERTQGQAAQREVCRYNKEGVTLYQIKKKKTIYVLFVYGCTESSLLRAGSTL